MASDFAFAASIDSEALQTAPRRRVPYPNAAIERWLEAERDQLALWLPVGLGLGIAAWFALPDAPRWAAFGLSALAVAAAALMLPAGGRARRSLLIFALAAATGLWLVWWQAERVAAPRLERAVVASFTATVEAVERLPARGSIRLRLAPIAAPALPARLRVNVAEADMAAGVAVGMHIQLRARLVPPPPSAVPGAYDFARVAWFQRLGATGKSLGPVKIVAGGHASGFWQWLGDLRARLSAHIQGRLAGGTGGIADALATGNVGAIPDADNEAMRRSGLAHLLSVSGLHITAAVAATMFVVLRLLALSPRLALHAPLLLIAAAAGALTGIGYTLLTGAEVPTVRSCVASLLVIAGIALGREAVTLRLVAAGALIVLLLWPDSLAGPSFQLSFAAVTTIVAVHEHPPTRAFFARREEGRAARFGRALVSLLITGAAVELALAPIAVFHFHRAGLYGAVANIVAIPLTTFVIMPLEALALLGDIVGIGAPSWWLAGQALALLLWIAHKVAAAPGAVAALPSMPDGAFALMVAGGLWLALWRTRLRRIGLVPIAAGAAWAFATPPPDLLVTGDGRHLALRTADGRLALLRPRAGDYVRGLLGEATGISGEDAPGLEELPSARCGADLCAVDLMRGGRRFRLLATRSPYLVDIAQMNRACAAADLVVSDRRLPASCVPRWLKADGPLLARTGGLAIRLAGPTIETVASHVGKHPWAQPPPPPYDAPRSRQRRRRLADAMGKKQ